jgi:hypothetical protein
VDICYLGGVHGLYIVINHLWLTLRRHWGHDLAHPTWYGTALARCITMAALLFSMAIFRADNLHTSWLMIKGLAGLNGVLVPELHLNLWGIGILAAGAPRLGDPGGDHTPAGIVSPGMADLLLGNCLFYAEHPGNHVPGRARPALSLTGSRRDLGLVALAAHTGLGPGVRPLGRHYHTHDGQTQSLLIFSILSDHPCLGL